MSNLLFESVSFEVDRETMTVHSLHYAHVHLAPASVDISSQSPEAMSKDSEVVLPDSAAPAEGVQVSLHPLPLLNISEHYTRVRIQNGGSLKNSSTKGTLERSFPTTSILLY